MGFEKLKDPVLSAAKETILNEGDLSPVVLFSLRDKIVSVIPLRIFKEQVEKAGVPERYQLRLAMALLGGATRLAREQFGKDFDAILLCHSAWIVKARGKEERTEIEQWIRQGRSLSEHPKRILCITLSYSEGISKHKMLEVPFQKTPDGPVCEESLSEFEEGAKMESIVMDNFWRGYELEPPKI